MYFRDFRGVFGNIFLQKSCIIDYFDIILSSEKNEG